MATLVLAYCNFETNMRAQLEYYKRTHGEEVVNEPPHTSCFEHIPITGNRICKQLKCSLYNAYTLIRLLFLAVYTFGSPRVGSLGFRQAFKKTISETGIYRVTNMNDMVPEMPGEVWCHVGTRVFISEEGLSVGVRSSPLPL